MNPPNPYEPPQVTELASPASQKLGLRFEDDHRDEQFLIDALGKNWRKVCTGAYSCSIAAGIAAVATILLFVSAEFVILVPLIALMYYFIGIVNLLSIRSKQRVRIYFVISLIGLVVLPPLILYAIAVFDRIFKTNLNNLNTVAILTCVALHWLSFLIGIRRIGVLLKSKNVVRLSSIVIGLSLLILIGNFLVQHDTVNQFVGEYSLRFRLATGVGILSVFVLSAITLRKIGSYSRHHPMT